MNGEGRREREDLFRQAGTKKRRHQRNAAAERDRTLDRPFWSKLRPDFCTLPICENSSCERREASDDWERGFSVRVPFGVRLRGCPRRCVGVNLEPRSELAVFKDLRGSEKSSRVLSVIGLARARVSLRG